jgi:predicted  nucleic acid-binding Zn-ribbon protein
LSAENCLNGTVPAHVPSPQRRPLALVWSKLIVSAYRTIGFVVLTTILVGLLSFLFTRVFYLFNRSWISPTLLSATDERMVRLNSEIVHQSMQRDRLLVERSSLEVGLRDAQRRAEMGASIRASLSHTALNEAKARWGERQRLHELSGTLDTVRNQVAEANRQFSDVSRKTLDEQFQAGLTTRDRYVAGGLQLGQLAQANLALAEKASDLAARREQMKREADALISATLGSDPGSAHLNVDALRLRQDFMRAALDVAKAQDEIKAYTEALATMDRSIARYGDLLKVLSEDPLLKALNGSITMAFVPYENLAQAHQGAPVFACRLDMLWCRKVGQVNQILPGEVSQHSPVESKNERGLMLEMKLQDAGHAEQNQVLFLNHAPFWL